MSGYSEAKLHIGQHEVRNRKELMKFMGSHGMTIDPSNTPWCAAFVGACERSVGLPGTGKYNARSYIKYGQEVKLKDAKQGDICVFARGGSTWQGHINYLQAIDHDSEGNTVLRCVGGNQSDAVTVGWYPLTRLLAIRRSP